MKENNIILPSDDSGHRVRNQSNYTTHAACHDTLNLDVTGYLIYRDVGTLLERHLYPHFADGATLRFLDFGCGVGLSTQAFLRHLNKHAKYTIETTGVDINQSNLNISVNKLSPSVFRRNSSCLLSCADN